MQPHEILDALYASEINCRVESFWDDDWIGTLGDDLSFAKVRGRTFAACVRELAAQACAMHPGSVFAINHGGKF